MLVVAYDIPPGCIGGYYPECNVLLPIWHYAIGSKTPAAKGIPVTVHPEGDGVLAPQLDDTAAEAAPVSRRRRTPATGPAGR